MTPQGQILPSSPFGCVLTGLAMESETIVEIGTWHGGGSTRCIANGLVRDSQRFYTIEPNYDCWREASEALWDPRITFIHGRTLDVLDQLPEKIDLILFDGENPDTEDEFDALYDRCRIIALDDTNEKKNRRQMRLLSDWDWKFLAGDHKDRNGWAVFRRPTSSP